MIILAAALTLGINIEIDLASLVRGHQRPSPAVSCGIKTVGYHFTGKPGQQFHYANETFTIPREGFVEVIALPRLASYSVQSRPLPLDDGSPTDAFSFRWITLPASPVTGGMK